MYLAVHVKALPTPKTAYCSTRDAYTGRVKLQCTLPTSITMTLQLLCSAQLQPHGMLV